eukprot:Awhi_evm1s4658
MNLANKPPSSFSEINLIDIDNDIDEINNNPSILNDLEMYMDFHGLQFDQKQKSALKNYSNSADNLNFFDNLNSHNTRTSAHVNDFLNGNNNNIRQNTIGIDNNTSNVIGNNSSPINYDSKRHASFNDLYSDHDIDGSNMSTSQFMTNSNSCNEINKYANQSNANFSCPVTPRASFSNASTQDFGETVSLSLSLCNENTKVYSSDEPKILNNVNSNSIVSLPSLMIDQTSTSVRSRLSRHSLPNSHSDYSLHPDINPASNSQLNVLGNSNSQNLQRTRAPTRTNSLKSNSEPSLDISRGRGNNQHVPEYNYDFIQTNYISETIKHDNLYKQSSSMKGNTWTEYKTNGTIEEHDVELDQAIDQWSGLIKSEMASFESLVKQSQIKNKKKINQNTTFPIEFTREQKIVYSSNKKHQCKLCGKLYSSTSSLRNHSRMKHIFSKIDF